jgi:glycosyltransferase involved in cell wall biosynthesis
MKARRIVLVLLDPPLPFGNAGARWYYVLLKGLTERGYAVSAFASCESERDKEQAQALFPRPAYDLQCFKRAKRGGLASTCRTVLRPHAYMISDEMRRALERRLAAGYDVLHMEQLWSGWFGLPHGGRSLVNVHYLFDLDFAGRRASSVRDWVMRTRESQSAAHLLRRYRTICTVSGRLSDHVRAINPAARVYTVPIALDPSLYPAPVDPPPRRPVLGLIGSFDWYPTYTAGVRLLRNLWPEIKSQVPEAKLRLVGREAGSAFAKFRSADDAIEIHENVPDILPHFSELDVMLYAPSQGSGMKVKVMEAFALGVPVVTTNDGVEGLPATDGRECGIANTDAGLIERAVRLLRDPNLRRSQRLLARALIEQRCSPGAALDSLEPAYADLAERPQ